MTEQIKRQIGDRESQMIEQLWRAVKSGQLPLAGQLADQITQNHGHYAQGWYAASVVAAKSQQGHKAVIAIERAIEIEPKQLMWQLFRVQLLIQLGDNAQALKFAQQLQSLSIDTVEDCAQLALLLNRLEQYPQADELYSRAIVLAKQQSNYPQKGLGQLYFNLASMKRYLGQLKQAESLLEQAISLNPDDFEAYLLRSSLTRQTKEHNHLNELTECLKRLSSQPNNALARAQVGYALAKEYEDLGQYEESFTALKSAADSRRSNIQYRPEGDIETLAEIRQVYDSQVIDKVKGSYREGNRPTNSAEPIFILGLPRTGSTLVERILGSHSEVRSAGELNNFAIAMVEECKKLATKRPEGRQALVHLSQHIDFAQLGTNYIDSTRPNTGSSAHFIDKLPLNSLYVGLIHLALPNAKIIYVKRHPLDTCYSIYKQLFTSGYPFSYQLEELGRYYIAHQQLMTHWQQLLPGVMHQVNYEDLVTDIETEAKKLVDYCGLEWQQACVDFHLNRQAATTASASQVREKVYASSIGRWRSYQSQLAPLKRLLESHDIDCS